MGFAWIATIAFIRLVTGAQILDDPMSTTDAVDQVDRWLSAPNAVSASPTSRHLRIMSSLLGDTGRGGNLMNDAHLAALANEHDATIASFDRDFARFTGLRYELPG